MVAALGLAAALASNCHDAPRTNPADPSVTVPVRIASAVLDSARGTVTVTWSRYAGSAAFAAYEVDRKVQGLEAVVVLHRTGDVADTTFVDTTVRAATAYAYRLRVRTHSGHWALSAPESVAPFGLPPPVLLAAVADSSAGCVRLRWSSYTGPDFEHYEVRRQVYAGTSRELAVVDAPQDTTWVDSTAVPYEAYLYSLVLAAGGTVQETRQVDVSYGLPAMHLEPGTFDPATATATLRWSRFGGPRFAGYRLLRASPGRIDTAVAVLDQIDATRYTDRRLEGNTPYRYRVQVVTHWPDVSVTSNAVEGVVYALVETLPLPVTLNATPQALALDLDASGRVYCATTLRSTTNAEVRYDGIWILFPDSTRWVHGLSRIASDPATTVHPFTADPGSRILLLGLDSVAVVAALDEDREQMLVGAARRSGSTLWARLSRTSAAPVGMHLSAGGTVEVIDSRGILHGFSLDGTPLGQSAALAEDLAANQALPISCAAVIPGGGAAGYDLYLFVSPQRFDHQVVGRTRLGSGQFTGRSTMDDGVGPGDGQMLNPLVVAGSAVAHRLAVVEAHGRLQILDARVEAEGPRYVTRLGGFGAGPGQVSVSPPTAVALAFDPGGRVWVADAAERIQVFAP
ncbi:MAG: hypothetical protein AB1505_09875 [Candidatus Latescibacterota bacterium]